MKIALIAVAGGFGSVLRYLIARWAQGLAGEARFPFGTLAVNIVGCLAIGFLSAMFAGKEGMREEYRLAITVGLLGGFTTFSAFGFDTFFLLSSGHRAAGLANLVLTPTLGLVSVWCGDKLGTALWGT